MEEARFKVEFIDQTALDQFEELPKTVQRMVGAAIKERLEIDPIALGKPLRYSLKGHRRIRINSYRVVYRVDVSKQLVTIVVIDHRKDIYDL